MSDLIERSEVLKQLRLNHKDVVYIDKNECARRIEAIPSADVVEVVRCKDCKHWHDHITTTWCSRGAELRPQESGWIKRNADDFCSYGEKEKDHE